MLTTIYKTLTIEEVKEILKEENTYLLDVRTYEEYEEEHLEKSINIPLNELQDRLEELDLEKKYISFCAHGVRSKAATVFLIENGFKNIFNSKEGIATWR